MKKLILTIFVLSFLIGCQQNDMLVSPDGNTEQVTSQAKEPNWLQLPQMDEAALQKSYTWTKSISGKDGGFMSLKFWYYNPQMQMKYVEAYARIDFPKNAWDTNLYGENIDISMKLDDGTVSATFSPHINFKREAKLNMYFIGLDLDENSANNIEFVYLAADGSYEAINSKSMTVQPETGYIEVKDAKIPHFSRFGFLN